MSEQFRQNSTHSAPFNDLPPEESQFCDEMADLTTLALKTLRQVMEDPKSMPIPDLFQSVFDIFHKPMAELKQLERQLPLRQRVG